MISSPAGTLHFTDEQTVNQIKQFFLFFFSEQKHLLEHNTKLLIKFAQRSTCPQVGILINYFVPGVENLNFFEENAKFPPLPSVHYMFLIEFHHIIILNIPPASISLAIWCDICIFNVLKK